MGNNNKAKKLIQDVLEQHHNDSKIPDAQKWMTRGAIARQLKAPSGRLNPARIAALNELVQGGVVEERKQPDTGKETHEFRLKNG